MTLAKQMSDTSRPKAIGDKLSVAEVNRELPVEMTAGEAMASTPVAVYVKNADGYVYKAVSTPFAENVEFIGFVMNVAGASGSAVAVQTAGVVEGFSGLTVGEYYYLTDTAGAISTAIVAVKKLVGIAISATAIKIITDNALEYIEIKPPAFAEQSNPNVWEDWDLSTIIGLGAKFVEVVLAQIGGADAGVREKGSSVDRIINMYTAIGAAESTVMTVKVNADRIIERYTKTATGNCEFSILGYWR